MKHKLINYIQKLFHEAGIIKKKKLFETSLKIEGRPCVKFDANDCICGTYLIMKSFESKIFAYKLHIHIIRHTVRDWQ